MPLPSGVSTLNGERWIGNEELFLAYKFGRGCFAASRKSGCPRSRDFRNLGLYVSKPGAPEPALSLSKGLAIFETWGL
jgi:hypothetical protein